MTNFALLLGGDANRNGGGADPCDSVEVDYLYLWLAMACVACALCCIFFSIFAIEIRFRKLAYDQEVNFNRISERVSSQMK